MNKHELNDIAASILKDTATYQATLEEQRFSPFIGKRVSFKAVDGYSARDLYPPSAEVEGTVEGIRMDDYDNDGSHYVYLTVAYRSPDSEHITCDELLVRKVTFL